MFKKVTAILCAMAVIGNGSIAGVTLSEIIQQPRKFDNQRVTVTGIADADAGDFTLYEDARAALRQDLEKAIYVRPRINADTSKFDSLRGHSVSVTGVVNAHRHGPLGAGFSCELTLESVKKLNASLVRLPATVVGRFQNAAGTHIHVKLFEGERKLYAEFDIPKAGSNRIGIHNGRALITGADGLETRGAIVVNVEARLTPSGEKPLLNFRITRTGIERVSSITTRVP